MWEDAFTSYGRDILHRWCVDGMCTCSFYVIITCFLFCPVFMEGSGYVYTCYCFCDGQLLLRQIMPLERNIIFNADQFRICTVQLLPTTCTTWKYDVLKDDVCWLIYEGFLLLASNSFFAWCFFPKGPDLNCSSLSCEFQWCEIMAFLL